MELDINYWISLYRVFRNKTEFALADQLREMLRRMGIILTVHKTPKGDIVTYKQVV